MIVKVNNFYERGQLHGHIAELAKSSCMNEAHLSKIVNQRYFRLTEKLVHGL